MEHNDDMIDDFGYSKIENYNEANTESLAENYKNILVFFFLTFIFFFLNYYLSNDLFHKNVLFNFLELKCLFYY